jgi:hypothetical protein
MSEFANEAGWDRIGRVALGAVLLYLGWAEVVTGGLGTFLKFFGFVPLLTGIAGWCPIYAMFRFRTNRQTASV